MAQLQSLVSYIQGHGIEVLSASEQAIKIKGPVFDINLNEWLLEEEEIEPTWKSVREALGYHN